MFYNLEFWKNYMIELFLHLAHVYINFKQKNKIHFLYILKFLYINT